jgi:hypothetical protein
MVRIKIPFNKDNIERLKKAGLITDDTKFFVKKEGLEHMTEVQSEQDFTDGEFNELCDYGKVLNNEEKTRPATKQKS